MAIKVSPIDMEARRKMDLRAGDTVRVHQKIEEKGKYRIQIFEGLVLARKHGTEAGGTFTVRRVLSGVGVEKVFPLYSPMIDKIEIVKRSRVRRAKLYYIRDKVAREARRQLRRTRMMSAVPAEAAASEGEVPADFANETEAEKELIVEQMTAPTDEKAAENEVAATGEKAE
jgi:large subunit ribosomal protein L19